MPVDKLVERAWAKGNAVAGHDPAMVRKDECGAWIVFVEYGNRESGFGWEIDRDAAGILRPLQWENQGAKTSDKLIRVVTSKGGANVRV